MNLALSKVWGLSAEMEEEIWQEQYEQQLFLAKRELRNLYPIPKLFDKKWELYRSWAVLENPHRERLEPKPQSLENLESYEQQLMQLLHHLERSMNFHELVQSAYELKTLMEAYRDWVVEITSCWADEWKRVEVNSREFFPTGAFLYAMKHGGKMQDWKMSLLKERKRISIVF